MVLLVQIGQEIRTRQPKENYIFFTMDANLNLAAILKNQNINFNFKFITDSIKNIPHSFSFLDLVHWSEISFDRKKEFLTRLRAAVHRLPSGI
jgi:hypothetical protein